jgi:MSHA biogenesis protein MshQ
MRGARGFALFLLLLAPLRPAHADVASYDFGNRTQGSQIFAYQGQSTVQTPTTTTTPSTQLIAAQYDAIETNDGVFHAFDANSNSNYAQMRFAFQIDQPETSVTQLTATWNGLNINNNNGRMDGARLYLWNYTTGAYELLQAGADTENEVTLSGARSANLTSYIGGAAQDTVLLLVTTNDTNQGTPKVNVLRTDYVQLQVTYGVGLDHFVISHDGAGIHCLAEPIGVTAVDASNGTFASYTGSITLDTQSGRGSWSLLTGGGTFLDAVADDGRATYTFASADSGSALFALSYIQGTAALDIDAFETAVTTRRDDDTEGTLTFYASGFTVTANALSNPPPNPINDPIANRTAGTTVTLHLAAYGTTPTDPQCGVIESYTAAKTLRFWTTYADPTTGTLVPAVNGTAIGDSEAGAVSIPVTFTNGQASVSAKYKDVGRIQIEMKDTTVPLPLNGIRGATNAFVWRPADLVITQVLRASDNFANPGVSVPTGTAFVAAGRPFGVKVQVRDAEGTLTPNYGRETSPEGLRLTASTLVAPVGGRNGSANDGAIGNATVFGTLDQNNAATAAGEFYGSAFSWDEVGAIRLRTTIGDGSYLNSGDVTGTESGTVGRFTPDNFVLALNTPRFTTGCAAGSFTYLGAPFSYDAANVPQIGVTATAAAGTTTRNYSGAWWRITNASLGAASYTALAGTLDPSGLASPDPIISDTGNGTGTLRYGSGTGLRFVRSALAAPFDAEISLMQSVIDLDAVAASTNPASFGQATAGNGIAFTSGKSMRFGRIALANAHGSELSNLSMSLRAEYWNGIGFIVNTADSCTALSTANLALTASPVTLATTPTIASTPLAAGDAGLVLSAPGAGNRGTVEVRLDLGAGGAIAPWLRYDWPADGLDGVFDDDPIGLATFGIFAGDDPVIFRREVY